MASSSLAPSSPVTRVYLQQRRCVRLRRVRRASRLVSVIALVALVVLWWRESHSGGIGALGSTRASTLGWASVLVPLLAGLLSWGVALVHSVLAQSHRIDSRLGTLRLESTRSQITTSSQAAQAGSTQRHGRGFAVLTVQDRHALQAPVRALEASIEESERGVQRSLLAATVAAAIGALGLTAALGASAVLLT